MHNYMTEKDMLRYHTKLINEAHGNKILESKFVEETSLSQFTTSSGVEAIVDTRISEADIDGLMAEIDKQLEIFERGF